MEKVFEQIGNIDSLYKLLALIIACIMFIVWSKWETISKWITSYFKQDEEDNKILIDLLDHPIFYRCEDIRQEVHEMEFTTHKVIDNLKTNLLHVLIDCQLDVIKESLSAMLEDDNNNRLSTLEMRNKCMELKNNITNSYCKRAKRIFTDKYGISDEDAEFLLDSYARYRRKFNGHFEVQMISIVINPTYNTNYKKVSVLFEVISMSLYSIPTQSKVAMDGVNGRFLKYANK